ncbi:NADH dehydrogenase (ubiquinone) complex I, assembly factor 6, partial [Lamellibrachia satsuma]
RKYDYENFLATLLLPKTARRAAFAIRAFNVEIAQIRDLVSERNIAMMRIQFWKGTLDKIYQGVPPETPVAIELAKAVKQHKLSKQWFARVLEAREDNLYDKHYHNLKEVEHYGEQTVSSIIYLILESLDVRNIHADHAASHLGKATGIVTLIRSVPFNAGHGHIYLPVDLMMQNGISQEEVQRGCREDKMKDLIYNLASQAHLQLEAAKSLKKDVPKAAIPAFLTTVANESYLKSIQRAEFDVFDSRLQLRNNWLPLMLWLRKVKNSY